jgi:hypothetical protein
MGTEEREIFNSKVKKIRIELPHYSFSHSSSGDSPHAFIGRQRTREKIKQVIVDSPDEPGVYLIAGNRGVGKTSLISEIIKETSLRPKSVFTENLRYSILLFLVVAGTNFITQLLQTRECIDFTGKLFYIWPVILIITFIAICKVNIFRHKVLEKRCIILRCIYNGITSAIKDMFYLINPYVRYGKMQYVLKIIVIVCCTQIIQYKKINPNIFSIIPVIVFLVYLGLVLLSMLIRFIVNKLRENKKNGFWECLKLTLCDPIFYLVVNYIKNYNRLYLRINFGHKLNDEKDILRLIARTLSTEYNKFHRSFFRMLPWRVIALCLLVSFACLFGDTVKKIYGKELEEVLSNIDNMVTTEVITKTVTDGAGETINKQKPALGYKVMNILQPIDKLIKHYIPDIEYIYILSFIIMYLFCLLLFNLAWVLHLFVTHGRIMMQLNKLNSNITHNTENEKSMGIGRESVFSRIMSRTKKSRGVADAREIEKELQDILNDIQRIPVIMCRPKIVMVFDELDKVEPSDTGVEKEVPQTKASLFSITATRERQTEILRILSNMKYFLSSSKAKFIFIAGREMYDIHLADVSERNNYIGSIFNVVILVPSFLTDHPSGEEKKIPQESSIASLPEEFVCRRLIPYYYRDDVEPYNLKNYRKYLEEEIYKSMDDETEKKEKIQKIIAILQQFIIYLAHVSKGAPKKMIQLFESFVEINIENRENTDNTLFVQRYQNSRHFLSFNYYKQYTLGIMACLITPVFYRLAESNIKELSDKLIVSSLRFVDFVFKFHKNSFSWKHLDMSPEMMEVNRAPELRSVVVDLLNYLSQIHINKSNFSLSEYKFDSLIANEIFAMAKTDEVFSALFSFSLDEMLPLKKQYQELLDNTKKEYSNNEKNLVSTEYINAISSLQGVLGDMYYYDDEFEQAEAYYKSAIQALHNHILKDMNKNEDNKDNKITIDQLYSYVRNMLRLGIIYEKRKQYDFAYLTYNELCVVIIQALPNTVTFFRNLFFKSDDKSFEQFPFEGLKILYLPFIAKLQILELSHIGGIAGNHLQQLDKEYEILTKKLNHDGARLLKVEFNSRVADILYYKNSDLKSLNKNKSEKNSSCTACEYYRKALSILLERNENGKLKDLLVNSFEQLKNNYNNVKSCTILARVLSDWGNVFFSCDNKENTENKCYICDEIKYSAAQKPIENNFIEDCINYLEQKKEDINTNLETKRDIAFTMYAISSVTYRRAGLYKRSSYQIYKMLCLFKDYKIYQTMDLHQNLERMSKMAIHYLWYANDDLNTLELNKRKKDFNIKHNNEFIPLQSLLVDTEITRVKILVKELELKKDLIKESKAHADLKKYYDLRITSPYKINYSIVGRIYRLNMKTMVNYETYKMILGRESKAKKETTKDEIITEIKDFLNKECNENVHKIFGNNKSIIYIFENLIAESIYCLMDAAQLLETMDETYLFPHSFIGTIHDHLSFWIRLYEMYEIYLNTQGETAKKSEIKNYLKKYLDQEWRELLSGYRENQRALSHYYKCLEMHKGGRAYQNMIDTMCYVMDAFNDRSDHFNIAEERHLIVNGDIKDKINEIKDIYKDSNLYKVDNYFKDY